MAAIRNHSRIARVDIARETGISAATVTSITADLVAEGLVEETVDPEHVRAGSRGRPRVLLQVRPDAFLIGGAKISAEKITVTLTDFAGEELSYVVGELAAPLSRTAGDVADLLRDTVLEALALCGRREEELASLGVGVPGFVDSNTGVIHWSACFGDRNAPFGDLIEQRFSCPVALDNDANLVALAEKWFGHGRGIDNFIVLTIEQGIGLGIVLDGKIFRGALRDRDRIRTHQDPAWRNALPLRAAWLSRGICR